MAPRIHRLLPSGQEVRHSSTIDGLSFSAAGLSPKLLALARAAMGATLLTE
jgi:hypothetical protein